FSHPTAAHTTALSLHDALPISLDTIAKPRPMVMPLRPPMDWPRNISSSVRATSKRVVRKTLMVFLPFYARANLAQSRAAVVQARSEEHTSELQSRFDLVCRLLL